MNTTGLSSLIIAKVAPAGGVRWLRHFQPSQTAAAFIRRLKRNPPLPSVSKLVIDPGGNPVVLGASANLLRDLPVQAAPAQFFARLSAKTGKTELVKSLHEKRKIEVTDMRVMTDGGVVLVGQEYHEHAYLYAQPLALRLDDAGKEIWRVTPRNTEANNWIGAMLLMGSGSDGKRHMLLSGGAYAGNSSYGSWFRTLGLGGTWTDQALEPAIAPIDSLVSHASGDALGASIAELDNAEKKWIQPTGIVLTRIASDASSATPVRQFGIDGRVRARVVARDDTTGDYALIGSIEEGSIDFGRGAITADHSPVGFVVRLDAKTRTIAVHTIRGVQVVVSDAAFDNEGKLYVTGHGTGPLTIGDRKLAADAYTRGLFLVALGR